MRYKNPSEVAGRYLSYDYKDDKGNDFHVDGSDSSANSFPRKVREFMAIQHHEVPDNLNALIEDQICQRLPAGSCWLGAGDVTANVIHSVARVADRAAKVMGIKSPELEKKAKGCSSCNKRRQALNALNK